LTEYFSVLSGALIGLGLVLLALARGVHIQNLNLLVFGSVPIKKPIEIQAVPRLFWPSLAALALGILALATPPATNLARQTYAWYSFTPITNMTAQDVERCKAGRANYGDPFVGDPNLDHFLALVIGELKRCARDIDHNNTGPYAEKYLAAVNEQPGEGWVSAFVGWAIKEANLDQYVDVSGTSATLRENFLRAGLLIEGTPEEFLVGDIVFMRTIEDQPNSVFPTVLIAGNDNILLLVSGNNRNHGFEFGGGMVGLSPLPKDDRRIDSVGRFKVERRSPQPKEETPAPENPLASAGEEPPTGAIPTASSGPSSAP
jgi:hypothetical protein